MLHEIIFALYGFPGDICTQMPAADPTSEEKSRLKLISDRLPFVAPSEIALVSQMLSIGEKYLRLLRFINKFSLPGSGSLYLTALAYGMDEILTEYRSSICSIESDLLRDPYIGISFIFSRIEPYRPMLYYLDDLLERCIKCHQMNQDIISCVFLVNDLPPRSVILRHLMRMFHHQLSSWLLHGVLHDPYREFCISEEGILSPEKVPTCISPTLVNDILYTGKAVRNAGIGLSDQLEKKFSHRFTELLNSEVVESDEKLEQLIREVWLFVAAEVSRCMFDDFELIRYLHLVKDILLLGRGELFTAFFDNLLAEGGDSGRDILDRPIPSSLAEARGLTFNVNAAFFAAARSVGMDDEILSGHFRFVVSTTPRKETSMEHDMKQINIGYQSAWDCLEMEFHPVPVGLESVFTEAVRDSYLRLFNFLLTIRRTEIILNNDWLKDRSRLKRDGDPDQRMLLRHQMSFIINNLNCYLQVDIITTAFEKLLGCFKNFRDHLQTNLGSVEGLHEAFIAGLESQALLLHPIVCPTLTRLLDTCRQFTYTLDCHSETRATFEHLSSTLFITLSTAQSAFSQGVGVGVFETEGGRSTGGHLSQLLLRLNFNRFFTKFLKK